MNHPKSTFQLSGVHYRIRLLLIKSGPVKGCINGVYKGAGIGALIELEYICWWPPFYYSSHNHHREPRPPPPKKKIIIIIIIVLIIIFISLGPSWAFAGGLKG